MNTKTRFGMFLIIAAAVFSVSAFVLWPSVVRGRPASNTPEQVVDAFYQEYLASIGEPGSEAFRNPLLERSYRESDLLTPSFKEHVDGLLDEEDGLRADPFLCAQDIPGKFEIQGLYSKENQAQAVIRTDLYGHVFTVDLRNEQDRWMIVSITCGGTPEGQAKAFYTWYLSAIGSPDQGNFNSPLADRAYRDCQFLSADFIKSIDQLLDEKSKGGFDPFLLAQDIPSGFSVDPGLTEDSAVAHMQFGKASVKHLQLNFVREDGQLLIDRIIEDIR